MQKKNIVLMYIMSALHGMIFYGAIATLYRKPAGVSSFEIAHIECVSLILCVALEMPWGIVADRIGYKKAMAISCGIYFLSKIVFWQADGYGMFLLERVMLAGAVSGISGVDVNILYLSSGKEHAQRTFGIYNSLTITGVMAAAGVYTLLIGSNYRLAGLLTVISYGVAFIISLLLCEVKQSMQRHTNQLREFAAILRALLRNRRLLLILVAVGLLNETQQMITVFLNQLQYVRAGMGPKAIGAVYMLVTASGLLGGFSAKLTDKLKPRRFGGLLFLGCAAGCAALALTGNALVSVAAILTLRLCFSLLQPLQMDMQNRAVKSDQRATALSVNNVLLDGVAILINLLLGGAADNHLPLALGMGAALCLAGFVLFMRGSRTQAA